MATTLIPAYGREYKGKSAILADWNAGKDFIIADAFSRWDGKPANRESFEQAGESVVNVRFAGLRKICVLTRGRDGVWK